MLHLLLFANTCGKQVGVDYIKERSGCTIDRNESTMWVFWWEKMNLVDRQPSDLIERLSKRFRMLLTNILKWKHPLWDWTGYILQCGVDRTINYHVANGTNYNVAVSTVHSDEQVCGSFYFIRYQFPCRFG